MAGTPHPCWGDEDTDGDGDIGYPTKSTDGDPPKRPYNTPSYNHGT